MSCPACGAEFVSAGGEWVCPRCSLATALDISHPATASAAEDDYERIEPLGAGAMGEVWLARDRRLDRLVALKVIPAGGVPGDRDRLLREGQSAARLRHPHVVAVHALGLSAGGIFLAMDFLEGGSLDRRLGGKPLLPRDAAALLIPLADAVAHAHSAGLLHRDIKPSNVLLDENGQPHLSDFGLAAPREGSGELTRPGQVLGTPAYLAPELLEGAVRASPASDIYGLGGVLYCALTGRPPFIADAVAAVLEQVRTLEPPAPRALKPDIPPDLETICLHCLDKDPSRRYPSAEAVRDDLKRFLAGEPIAARPVTRLERAWRWTRRNRALALSLGSAAALLLALSIGGPLAALRIESSRRTADTAAASSAAVNDFLENDLLGQADPVQQADRNISLRDVLDRAAKRIDGRFQGQPAVEASLRETIARTYVNLGDYATALQQIQTALPLQLAAAGPSDPAAFRLWSNQIVCLRGLGRYAEAEKLGEQVLQGGLPAQGWIAPERLALANSLLSVYLVDARYADAARLGEQTLAIKRRQLGPDDRSTVATMLNLSRVYANLHNYDKAEAMDRAGVASLLRTSGPDAPRTLAAEHNLAATLLDRQKLGEAEPLADKVLAARRRVLGPEHPETLRTLHLVAEIQHAKGNNARARALYGELLAIRRRVLGPNHPDTKQTENYLRQIPASP